MKRTYMIPTLQVVKIQPAQFIATSEKVGVGTTYSGGTVLSRQGRFSRWEEDFDEE